MTQKELLYVEDAVEHEKSIIKLCNDFLNKLEKKLKTTFVGLSQQSDVSGWFPE